MKTRYLIGLIICLIISGCGSQQRRTESGTRTTITIYVTDTAGVPIPSVPLTSIQRNFTGGTIVGGLTVDAQGKVVLSVERSSEAPPLPEWYEFQIDVPGYHPQTQVALPTRETVTILFALALLDQPETIVNPGEIDIPED